MNAVNNWYNPTSHERNRKWETARKQRERVEKPPEESLAELRETAHDPMTTPTWRTGCDKLFESDSKADEEESHNGARGATTAPTEQGQLDASDEDCAPTDGCDADGPEALESEDEETKHPADGANA